VIDVEHVTVSDAQRLDDAHALVASILFVTYLVCFL
jgi:hypothetical protein